MVLAVVAGVVAWQGQPSAVVSSGVQELSISGARPGMSLESLSELCGVSPTGERFVLLCQDCRKRGPTLLCLAPKKHQPTTVLLEQGQVVAVAGSHLMVDEKRLSKADSINTISGTINGLRRASSSAPYESGEMSYPGLGLKIKTENGRFLEAELSVPNASKATR